MSEIVVTSFSPDGAELYGRRMVESYLAHWPIVHEPLVVYLDAPVHPSLPVEERWTRDLSEWVACRQRWGDDPVLRGRSTPERPLNKPYKYQWDLVRFSVKPFVWRDAARRLGQGVLTWLDGDTLTRHRVSAGWTTRLLNGADVAFLGRGGMHPETGYVGFRIPEALPLLEWCCETYRTDRFREIYGWTDCHILRAGLAAVPLRTRDLTSHLYDGHSHIWPVSPLARYLTHLKGKQKRKAVPA